QRAAAWLESKGDDAAVHGPLHAARRTLAAARASASAGDQTRIRIGLGRPPKLLLKLFSGAPQARPAAPCTWQQRCNDVQTSTRDGYVLWLLWRKRGDVMEW